MTPDLFILLLFVLFAVTLPPAIRLLPGERWQVLATVPLRRLEDGRWQGINLTWYGLLSANAYAFAVAAMLLLAGSLGVARLPLLLLIGGLLAVCVPAASLVARWVEGKANTLTVGGAVFVGTVLAPWTVLALDRWSGLGPLPVLPLLAAMAISYGFGEGLGRVACLSFGCCYGKPLHQCRPLTRQVFRRWALVFTGKTKKIAYASGLDDTPVMPVQVITSLLCLGASLGATALFLHGRYRAAFLLAMGVTQLWRVYSETLRADHRGGGRLSAYQIMGLCALPYSAAVAFWLGGTAAPPPVLGDGLLTLWQPLNLLLLQGLWWLIFLHTGRSAVTGAVVQLHVHTDRI